MSIPFIDLKAQYRVLQADIRARIDRVLEHGQYIMGPEVRELEERLEDYIGAGHCITVASGTEALLIALMALEIGPGDEVVTTPFTFAATAEMIALLGATPIFVDCQPDTCNIDPKKIADALSPKTKAIIPVSLYGQPPDMDEINAIAERHGGVPVIEDAAQSLGSEYKGRKSGNLSRIACTSFFPSKPLGCYGDGGAIFTNDAEFAQICREVRVHGQSKRYTHTRIGVGGRMDTLQCAVVLAKLTRFNWEVSQRLTIGARYSELLAQHGIDTVSQRADRTSVFAQYTIFVDRRDQVQEGLRAAGIPTAIHYPMPLNLQPAYRRPDAAPTPVASSLANRVLSLPMGPYLEVKEQDRIIEKLLESVQNACA